MVQDYERAELELRKLVDRTPEGWLWRTALAWALIANGNVSEAVQEMESAVQLSGRTQWALIDLGRAYAAAGRMSDARRVLNELNTRSQDEIMPPAPMAGFLTAMGDKEAAIKTLNDAKELNSTVFMFHIWPTLRPLWNEPEFFELVNQIGIAYYNEETQGYEVNAELREKIKSP